MPVLLKNPGNGQYNSGIFTGLFNEYLGKEGFPPVSFSQEQRKYHKLFQEITVKPNGVNCLLHTNEYLVFGGNSIFDMDLFLFIKSCRAMNADIIAALNFCENAGNKRLFGLEDDFSLYVRTDTEGLWIDGYEDGGVYYVREQAFPYLLEAAQESGNLLLSGLLGKRPSRPAIKGLPMGGIMWSGETFNDFQERHVLVQKRTPAIFLDRDGVIIEDTGYVCGSDLKFMDRIFPLIEQANSAHIPVVVVTNQSGISRGYFAEKDVEQTHAFIDRVLQEKGLRIDRFYYCPYHVKGKVEKYRKKSLCRKPDPGMVLKACRDMGLDLSASLMIGDRERDRIKLPYLDFCLFH